MELENFQELDFLALMPCALKVPFEELFINYVRFQQEKGQSFECLIESNVNNDLNFFTRLASCTSIDQLPQIMMAPGFNRFFYRSFTERFLDEFVTVGSWESNSHKQELGLHDPDNHYTIPCFNPTLLLVDRTVHEDLPIPKRWEDILEPEYEGLVALRGHQLSNFCEGVLLNTYKDHGEEGVKKLGRAVKTGLHPSQMVKYAGSGKKEAPVISTVPYSFARLVKTSELVSLVWPEDGAILNPLVMLVKASSISKLGALGEFIAGPEIGQVFSSTRFPSFHALVNNDFPPEARFKWLGWDFIKQNDLEELIPRLHQILIENIGEKRL